MKAAVVIPFYKNTLTPYEQIALEQCFKVLAAHPIIAIKPESLVLPGEVTSYSFSSVISFNDSFFKGIEGYNRLMLSQVFYKEFLEYGYILIYQLDAFVFKDELDYWCAQGIDYVGAPWIRPKNYSSVFKKYTHKALQYFARRYNIKKHGLPSKKQFDDGVGNGGFSLRRVKIFYDSCIKYHQKIEEYNLHPTHHYNEDVFWGIELNRKRKVLKVPGYKRALQFAFEVAPERSFNINNHKLPFGCHAWDLNIDYWRPVFKDYGYTV
jgi:hypothetical protein